MTAISWVLSGTSAVMLWAMGNRWPWAPAIGLGNQVLWIVYVVATRQWGLLPGVLLYTAIHGRNLAKWLRRE